MQYAISVMCGVPFGMALVTLQHLLLSGKILSNRIKRTDISESNLFNFKIEKVQSHKKRLKLKSFGLRLQDPDQTFLVSTNHTNTKTKKA